MVVDKRGVIMERLQQHRHHLLHRQHRAVRVELLLHLLTLHARPHEPRVLSPTLVVEVKLHENSIFSLAPSAHPPALPPRARTAQ